MSDVFADLVPPYVRNTCRHIKPVGSRVTCNPPVMDTDEDYLVLWPEDAVATGAIVDQLKDDGWSLDGSFIADESDYRAESHKFQSYSRGRINLITTRSRQFFARFMAASSVAKRLNLLSKADRIMVFQAVLYGNPADAPDV